MKSQAISDPFALMMNPQAVLMAVALSERLQSLESRICRPLDKPLLSRQGDEAEAFDSDVDAQVESFGDTEH